MLDTLSAETRQALIQEVAAAVRQDADFRAQIQADLLQKLFHPHIQVHVLPGGKKPQPATDGAIGYDVCARSIVSTTESRYRAGWFSTWSVSRSPSTRPMCWSNRS